MEAQRCSSIAPFAVPHYATKDTQLQGYNIPQVTGLHAIYYELAKLTDRFLNNRAVLSC